LYELRIFSCFGDALLALPLGLWELDREAGDVARRDGGLKSVRCKSVGVVKLLDRGAPWLF